MIKGDVKIELEDIGEGLGGDYDEADEDDVPLLRFYCSVKGELRRQYVEEDPWSLNDQNDKFDPEEWVELSDGSYCTQLPATLSVEDQKRAEAVLMDKLYGHIAEDIGTYKTPAEEASWIDPTWLNKEVA